jgi:hypothetical protein
MADTAPTASELFLTRKASLDQVRAARSWSTLIDASTRALHANRGSWGDSFEMSKQAAAVWSIAIFPTRVSAPSDSVDITSERPQWSPGPERSRAAFQAAKELSLALLSPLPESRTSDSSALVATIATSKKSLYKAMFFLETFLQTDPLDISHARPRSKSGLLGLILGVPLALFFIDRDKTFQEKLSELTELSFWRQATDWESLGRAGPEFLHASSRRLQCAELEASWDALIEAGGFCALSTGAQGGLGAMLDASHMLMSEAIDFSRLSGIAKPGLGSMAASVNLFKDDGAGVANFQPQLWTLNFMHGSQGDSLAHEWTHALEHMTRSLSDAQLDLSSGQNHPSGQTHPSIPARLALDELHTAIASLKPCPQSRHLIERSESRFLLKTQFTLAAILRMDKKISSHPDRELLGSEFKEEKQRARQASLSIIQGAKPGALGLDGFFTLLRASFTRDLTSLDGDAVDSIRAPYLHLHERRACLDQAIAGGESAFMARAKADEITRAGPKAYYTDPGEMLARSAQAHFASLNHELGHSTATFDPSLPSHGELAQISPLFERWILACRPMVEHAMLEDAKLSYARAAQPLGIFRAITSKVTRALLSSNHPGLNGAGAQAAPQLSSLRQAKLG